MTVRLVRPPLLAAAPYAHVAVVEAGTALVLSAGACPLDEHGAVVGADDVARQAECCMDNLETALAAAGASLAAVATTTVLVATSDRADLVTAWDVVRARMGAHDAPSTLVGVTVLGHPGQLVEVEAVAAVR